MAGQLRPEEVWAAALLEASLPGVRAHQHDDGSRPGMYDLKLLRSDGVQVGACEVSAAADASSIELWNLFNGTSKTWAEPEVIDGGWLVALSGTARARAVRRELPSLLAHLEANGQQRVSNQHATLGARLRELGVTWVSKGRTSTPGSIYLTVNEGTRGVWMDGADQDLVEWVSDWLGHESQEHNVAKLRRSAAKERHMFVLLPPFTVAPTRVEHLLMSPSADPPTATPVLPQGLTHLWLSSTWSSGGVFHWSNATGWVIFDKVAASWSP